MGLEMDLTHTELFPGKLYYAAFFLFSILGTDLVLRVSPWGFFMYFWAIWAVGLGWNEKEEDRADLMMPG